MENTVLEKYLLIKKFNFHLCVICTLQTRWKWRRQIKKVNSELFYSEIKFDKRLTCSVAPFYAPCNFSSDFKHAQFISNFHPIWNLRTAAKMAKNSENAKRYLEEWKRLREKIDCEWWGGGGGIMPVESCQKLVEN